MVRRTPTGAVAVELLETMQPFSAGDVLHMEPWEVQSSEDEVEEFDDVPVKIITEPISFEVQEPQVDLKREFLALRSELQNARAALQALKRDHQLLRDSAAYTLQTINEWFVTPDGQKPVLALVISRLLNEGRLASAAGWQWRGRGL